MQMQKQTPHDVIKRPDKKRFNRWVVACVVVAITLVATGASMLWNMKQEHHDKYRDLKLLYGVKIVDKKTEEASSLNRNAYLANAMVLRERWSPWALQHRGTLNRLLHAKGEDYAALMQAYDALPVFSTDAGMHLADVDINHRLSTDFTWNPSAKAHSNMESSDPEQQAKLLRVNKSVSEHLRQDFAQYHDIELSQSFNDGMSHIVLWASGRVTEESVVRQNIPGKETQVKGTPRQLAPPYDFLR